MTAAAAPGVPGRNKSHPAGIPPARRVCGVPHCFLPGYPAPGDGMGHFNIKEY